MNPKLALTGINSRRTGASGRRRRHRNGMADRDIVLPDPHLANEQTHDSLTFGKSEGLCPFAQPPRKPFRRLGQRIPGATVKFRSLQGPQCNRSSAPSRGRGSGLPRVRPGIGKRAGATRRSISAFPSMRRHVDVESGSGQPRRWSLSASRPLRPLLACFGGLNGRAFVRAAPSI